MAVRPTANVESNTPSNQGIARSTGYLKNIDPTSYYYYKLKQSGNKYLDDSMYREAASRGEADYLISLLQEREKAAPVTDLGEHAESLGAISSKQEDDIMAKWKEYGGRDYDSYIMALAIPTMDDTVKKARVDEASGYDFGEYTDKEWALEVLNSNYQRLDAEMMEEWKRTHGFLAALTTIGTGALRVVGGAVNFLQDIANVGEGLLNMLVNWSDDSNLGARFLAAFADDGNAILDAANEVDKRYGFTIDAVQTYEQGQYVQTGFGKYFAGLTESIGYMLPSMLTGGGSALFYAGIAAGNVKDYVASASQNGISYKDLNAGEVIANSVVKAAAQYGVEIALGKLIGFSGLDRMLGIGKGAEATWKTAGKATKPWLSAKFAMSAGEKMARSAVQTGKKAFGELALRAGKSFVKEGLEESLQDLSDGILDMVFSKQGTNLSEINVDMAKEKINVSNIVDSFVLGGLTSMVMGSVANLKYIAPSQRGVYMDADGEAHHMGYFQTINFNEALKTMNEWNDTVNDTKVDLQTRRDTALKMTVALKTLGSVVTNMGASRALKANQILSAYANDKEKKQSVANLSAMNYATKLYDDFLQDYSLIKEYKRLADTKEGGEVLNKIKKALGDKSDELKKAGTTKLQEAIIKNAKVTPDNSMIAESKYQMLQRALDQLGVKVIVGTDSSVVVKSEDVLFVPNQWLQDGDLSQIIQGVAYKQVEEVCLNSLTKGQQDMLKRLYKRITGIDGTMTEVMQALLFDKSFYTKVLLYSEEGTAKDRQYSHKDALQILANIGAVAKKAALIQLKNGSLSNKAYNTLMSKVRETLKTGLVVYATQYCQIDLDSPEVREILDRSEIESIRNNPNNIFTEEVNALSVDEDFSINEKKLAGARRIINHFITMGYITPEQGLTLLMNANKGVNGRFELQATIIALSVSSRSESRPSYISKRLLYLLKPEYGSTFTDAITLNEFEKATGISLRSLRAGQFDELDLTASARMYAYEMGYNLTNENDRNLFFSEMLYNVSKETLMLDEAYNLIQPLKANDIVDPKYLGPNGNAKFRRLISSIDNLKVKDILRKDIELPDYILNVPIQYVETDTNRDETNRGEFDIPSQTIILTNYSTISTLIHEVTHLTQYMSKQTTQGKGAYKAGGSLKTFKNTSNDIVQQIWKYIEKTFPILAEVLKNKVVDGRPMTKSQLLYFVLGGEMQARLTADTELLAAGFRYKNNGRLLVAPDGTEFNLVLYSEPSTKNSKHIDYELPDTRVMADVGLNIKQMKMKAIELKDKISTADTMAEVNPDMFKQLKIKQVKEGQKKVSTEKSYEYNRYVPNKRAKLSNLKYWMQKGKPIEMNEHLANFIEATTPEEIYNQLPNKLKDKIAGKHAGTLKPIDIEQYVGNAGEMNDSTFKALAKYYYNNEELAKMTFEEMRELQQHIPEFAMLRYLLNDITSEYTYDELMTLFKDMKDGKIKIDAESIRKTIAEKKNVPYSPLEDDDIVTISIEGLKQKIAKRRKESYIPKSGGDVIEFSIKDLESKLKKQRGNFDPKIFGKKNAEIINKLSEKEQNALISEVSRKLTYNKSKEEKTEQFLKKTLATVRDLATTVKIQGKKGNYFREVQIEPNTTNLLFFNYFNGTLGRLEDINNLAKYAQMMYEVSTTAKGTSASKAHDTDDSSEISAVDTATGEQSEDSIITGNNWIDRRYTGDVVDIDTATEGVDTEELSETFENFSRTEKMLMLEPVMYDMATKLLSKKYPNLKLTNEIINNAVDQLYDQLANYNEEQFNKFFMARTANIINANKAKVQLVAQAKELEIKAANVKAEAPNIEAQKATTKNLKDGFRNRANRIIRRLSGTGLSLYNKLSDKAKEYIIAKQHPYLKSQYTFELSPNYRLLSDKELESLNTQLSADNKVISGELSKVKRAEKTQSKVEKISQQNIKYKEKLAQREKEIERKEKLAKEAIEITEKLQKVQTMKQKVKAKKPFIIKGAKFDQKATPLANNLLNTTWSKERMSTVQFVSNNKTENVINGKEFFNINRDAIESADLATIEDTVNWFCNVEQLPNKTLSEIRDFMGIRMLFLSYVLGESVPGGRYENISPNLKTQIENTLKADVTTAGLTLSEWQNAMKLINPIDTMKNQDIVVDGVSLPPDVKNQLFDAIDSGSIKDVKAAMEAVVTYATSRKGTTRQSLLRKITAIRSMMMLSSPVTWLRNKVSNFMLKRINKLSSAIGNKVWSKVGGENQLKLDGKVSVRFDKNGHAIFSSDAKITTNVQNFINKNFLDNGFFDTIVSNLSKYDPSDIKEQYKTKAGMPKKEALMVKMVMKAMYNKYYNESTFNSNKMKWLQQQLMKMMSDESYIREAAVRYFGHILAENKYDLSKGVTDAVMNDFSSAVGLALNDYMHSDNFFNTFERAIAAKGTKASEIGLFAYKLILPFASASWNWFKAAINMSPIGLAKSIVQLSRLEKNIQQAEIDFAAGKSNLDPRLKAYMLKRNFGQGVIGTILLGLGSLLAGLGFIRLEDDDYGTPKLHIGGITVDVSSIFGSSSLLAGAALVAGWKQGDFMSAMNAMIDFALEDMPLMDIVQMDMYSDGGFSIGLDQLESIALSFIPNMLSWIAGATYSGEVKYSSNKGLKFLERAAAKIPFLGNFLNKKVNPYTGKTGSYIKAINRFVPYFSIDTAENNELKSQALGLNKSMLNGKYSIEGESFNIKGKLLTATNQAYGQWNAKDLGDFYTDNFRVTIKVGNKYKSLLYSQMTDEQRKTAVQTIMSNNAELAKIYAWTQSGHKYYASSEIYQRLRKYGIKTNVYIGNQGFKK